MLKPNIWATCFFIINNDQLVLIHLRMTFSIYTITVSTNLARVPEIFLLWAELEPHTCSTANYKIFKATITSAKNVRTCCATRQEKFKLMLETKSRIVQYYIYGEGMKGEGRRGEEKGGEGKGTQPPPRCSSVQYSPLSFAVQPVHQPA